MESKYDLALGGANHGNNHKRKGIGSFSFQPVAKKQCNTSNQNGAASASNRGAGAKPKPLPSSPSPQMSLMDQRRALPVYQVRDKLMQAIAKHPTLIIIGETGSGKTTQIPQLLLDAGYTGKAANANKQIAVTQPRRVAAITLARRVAAEAGCKLGTTVGYTVRFEDVSCAATRIKYVTDGTLLREALGDRLLGRYAVVVLDEAHERTINTDVLFGLIKKAQRLRAKAASGLPPLKVIVMSATMDVDHFAKYWNGSECLYLAGRAHPVRVMHAKRPQSDYVLACVSTLFEIHESAPANHDVLIFLTGQEEIEHTAAQIRTIVRADLADNITTNTSSSCSPPAPRLYVHTLYSQQSQNKQLDAFKPSPPNSRKVVLCTNIAETSLTISGIRYVIDSGRVKRSTYDALTGMDMLRVERIAQDQVWQRTGRAGREAAGYCYRTFTLQEYAALAPSVRPEILRSNIVTTVLQLAHIGVDCASFDFIDRPDAAAVADAKVQLRALGAFADDVADKKDGVDDDDDDDETAPVKPQLTEMGRQMARFPLDPRFSRMLLAAPAYGCLEAMLSIVAVLSGESVFAEPPPTVAADIRAAALQAHAKFTATNGDHQTLLNVYRGFERDGGSSPKMWCTQNSMHWRNLQYASEVRYQLRTICQQLGLLERDEEVRKANGAASSRQADGDDGDDDSDERTVLEDRKAADAADAEAEDVAVRRCLLAGLLGNVADLQLDGHTYRTRSAKAQRVKLHPSSRLTMQGGSGGKVRKERPQCVVYTELILTGQCYMRYVTAVEADWIGV